MRSSALSAVAYFDRPKAACDFAIEVGTVMQAEMTVFMSFEMEAHEEEEVLMVFNGKFMQYAD